MAVSQLYLQYEPVQTFSLFSLWHLHYQNDKLCTVHVGKSNENVEKIRKVGDKKDTAIRWWETEEGQRNEHCMLKVIMSKANKHKVGNQKPT